MGNNHSKATQTKGGDEKRQAYQQPKVPTSVTPDCAERHSTKSNSSHHKRTKTSSRHVVFRDLTTVTTTLSRYANHHAIQKVLKEKLGESLIQTVDGMSIQQWRIEETDDEIKRIHACRELTKVEQQAIYYETHRPRREGTMFHANVKTPEYT